MASADLPDWRDGEAYALLAGADRALLAWEWLRRDSAYRADSERPSGSPLEWGLHRFEPFGQSVPVARPLWTRERLRTVLRASAAAEGRADDLFDVRNVAPLATVVGGAGENHLGFCDGTGLIRLDVRGADLARPVRLSFEIEGLASARRSLPALHRFLALLKDGRIPAETGAAQKRRRHILALRAHDALARGATQREIAMFLLEGDDQPGWRSADPSLRLRSQRLVKSARAMASGAYWSLFDA